MASYYKIAGLTVQMDTFGRTQEQAKPYLCEEAEPQIVVRSNWQALQVTQPHLSKDDCEYLYTGSVFYRSLLQHDGFLLHSSAVVVDGKAYLFSAPCGTGKSTHTKLWLKVFGDRAYILNEEKPALRLENGTWYAYGTPWSGKHDLSTNSRVPVAGICFLQRGSENKIRPFGGVKAAFAFLEQTARPPETALRTCLMDLLQKFMGSVPVWLLECNMEPQAAVVSYEAMSGETYKR